tara:strand:+ start:132 stop:491 length:360 start_codon:yes stop_codon:yes gene_type:complete
MKVGIIGSGAFGTALAKHLEKNSHTTRVWSRNGDTDHDINDVIAFGEVIFNTTLVFAVRETFEKRDLKGKILISVSKGIEKDTHQLVHQIFKDIGIDSPYVALSGPSFAKEVEDAHLLQ